MRLISTTLEIFKFENQMVVVIDKNGKQVPRLQGWVGDALPRIIRYLKTNEVKADWIRDATNELKFNSRCHIILWRC